MQCNAGAASSFVTGVQSNAKQSNAGQGRLFLAGGTISDTCCMPMCSCTNQIGDGGQDSCNQNMDNYLQPT